MKLLDLHLLLQNTILTEKPLINSSLHLPPKGTIADRVAIYTNGFHARLEEALKSDYGTLASIIGEDEFSQLCRDYVVAYPSQSYTLDFLGQNFSQFLTETSPYSDKPYLAEIASFEWAEAQAIIAYDAKLLLASDLQSLPVTLWPEIKCALHPSCTILNMHWNTLSLIDASRAGNVIPEPEKIKMAHSVIVWRRQLDIRYYQLNERELTLLETIRSQASFLAICECLSQIMPENEVADFLVQELYAWINEQALIPCSR